jgi:hypothetical protein
MVEGLHISIYGISEHVKEQILIHQLVEIVSMFYIFTNCYKGTQFANFNFVNRK